MVDFVPEWDEDTNIKLGAKKVSSVVISSSISVSVTMRLLKRQMNRTEAEPRTWTLGAATPIFREKDKSSMAAGTAMKVTQKLKHKIFDTNQESTGIRLYLMAIFESFSLNSALFAIFESSWNFNCFHEAMKSLC